jgi:glyoxylase-like metal-dependent hydrolase (beta-lactamase superfamily II)
VVMPDGTTLLVDAGAATAPFADPRPNGTRSPAGWIAYYIDHVLPASAARHLDYALITHFHPDHMGQITADSPVSKHGDDLPAFFGPPVTGERRSSDVLLT